MPNIKAREIDNILRKNGVERGTIMIMTHLIERINDLEAAQTVCGQLMDKQTEIISQFGIVAENMRDVIEDLKPKQ